MDDATVVACRPRPVHHHRARARHQPLPAGSDVTDRLAVRIPGAAARAALRRAAPCSTGCARSSSCTASRRSRPAPSSRSTRCCARARSTRRSTSCAGCTPTTTTATPALGLHFDLTVPFARYVLENAGHLEFPFRRYQIQKVWRGERPQEGRYREFTQADIDVVGTRHAAVPPRRRGRAGDGRGARRAGLPAAAAPAGQQPQADRGLLPRPRRRPTSPPSCASIDKLDKVPADVDRASSCVDEAGLTERAGRAVPGAGRDPRDRLVVRRRRCWALGVAHQLLDEGLDELAAVIDGCASASDAASTVEADLRIARGLDYYTGTVFETRMAGYESLGSICSGGRYDSLASDGKTTYPGVGISLGVTRLLMPLFQRGVLDGVAVGAVGGARRAADRGRPRPAATAIAQTLRARGIADRGGAAAAEVRQADPLRRAARHPVRLVPGAPTTRRRRRGQGHPQRRAGRGRSRHLAAARPKTCARR